MPMKSRKQWAYMFGAESRGELPEGTARRWAHHTKTPFKKLPKKVKKAHDMAVHGLPGYDTLDEGLKMSLAQLVNEGRAPRLPVKAANLLGLPAAPPSATKPVGPQKPNAAAGINPPAPKPLLPAMGPPGPLVPPLKMAGIAGTPLTGEDVGVGAAAGGAGVLAEFVRAHRAAKANDAASLFPNRSLRNTLGNSLRPGLRTGGSLAFAGAGLSALLRHATKEGADYSSEMSQNEAGNTLLGLGAGSGLATVAGVAGPSVIRDQLAYAGNKNLALKAPYLLARSGIRVHDWTDRQQAAQTEVNRHTLASIRAQNVMNNPHREARSGRSQKTRNPIGRVVADARSVRDSADAAAQVARTRGDHYWNNIEHAAERRNKLTDRHQAAVAQLGGAQSRGGMLMKSLGRKLPLAALAASPSLIPMAAGTYLKATDKSAADRTLSDFNKLASDFHARNEAAKERNKDSVMGHIRDGYIPCPGCHTRYHVMPDDNKCPSCGAHMSTYLRSMKRGAHVPKGGTASYDYHCTPCDHSFDANEGKCPLCTKDRSGTTTNPKLVKKAADIVTSDGVNHGDHETLAKSIADRFHQAAAGTKEAELLFDAMVSRLNEKPKFNKEAEQAPAAPAPAPAPAAAAPPQPPAPPPGQFKPSPVLSNVTTPNSPSAQWIAAATGTLVPPGPPMPESTDVASGQQLQNNMTLQKSAAIDELAKRAAQILKIAGGYNPGMYNRPQMPNSFNNYPQMPQGPQWGQQWAGQGGQMGAQPWGQQGGGYQGYGPPSMPGAAGGMPGGFGAQPWGGGYPGALGGPGMGSGSLVGPGLYGYAQAQQRAQNGAANSNGAPDYDNQLKGLNRQKAYINSLVQQNPRAAQSYKRQLKQLDQQMASLTAMQQADAEYGQPKPGEPQAKLQASPFDAPSESKGGPTAAPAPTPTPAPVPAKPATAVPPKPSLMSGIAGGLNALSKPASPPPPASEFGASLLGAAPKPGAGGDTGITEAANGTSAAKGVGSSGTSTAATDKEAPQQYLQPVNDAHAKFKDDPVAMKNLGYTEMSSLPGQAGAAGGAAKTGPTEIDSRSNGQKEMDKIWRHHQILESHVKGTPGPAAPPTTTPTGTSKPAPSTTQPPAPGTPQAPAAQQPVPPPTKAPPTPAPVAQPAPVAEPKPAAPNVGGEAKPSAAPELVSAPKSAPGAIAGGKTPPPSGGAGPTAFRKTGSLMAVLRG